MTLFLAFTGGLFLGGILGFVAAALLAASRSADNAAPPRPSSPDEKA